jgi:hypothetical protein
MSGGKTKLRIRMQNTTERNPTVEQRVDSLPAHFGALTAATENRSPHPAQPMHRGSQPLHVARHSVILVVAYPSANLI